jgi:DNA modification methylase
LLNFKFCSPWEVPLPFDFANELKAVGWKLQEIIIWQKDRTVPWAHKGQMRNLFEYILVFSKTDNFEFYIDEVRDPSALKKWWAFLSRYLEMAFRWLRDSNP